MKKIFIFLPFLFIACGYKPSSVYQQKVLGKNIYPQVVIDIKNPRETIFLKYALNHAIYTILNGNVCYKNCDSKIVINPSFSSLDILDYDKNGYPVLYRSRVILSVDVFKQSFHKHYIVDGSYDFRIEPQSILNDEAKLSAYKNASINALNKFFALITKDGVNL